MKTRISIANRQKSLRPDQVLLRRTLCAILGDHPDERLQELSVALVDDREMQRVHREFLGEDSPTDVMSFRYDGDGPDGAGGGEAGVGGELVISAETALREARARGIPPGKELLRYAIHGLLHVLGYDDRTPAGRRQMRRLEEMYLKKSRIES
jgi:probable rRNA maturation factor